MKFALSLVAFLLSFSSVRADELGPRSLESYLVFAKGGIQAARSDFQGASGAGGRIQLTDLFINGALVSGDQVQFLRGTIAGGLFTARPSRLTYATSRGVVRSAAVAERTRFLSGQMDTLAARVAALPATAVATRGYDGAFGRIDVTAASALEVVDISVADLAGVQNLVLHGDGASLLVLRVHGIDIRLVGGFFAEGIRPSQVLLFFPEAEHLELGGGGARDAATGALWGIPGSVLAPCAVVDFSRALLTGQLYAGALRSAEGGQVNAGAFEALPQLLGSCAAGCDRR